MIRLAQIGVGYWGKNLLRNFYEIEGAEVKLVCDHDPNALAAVARKTIAVETCLDSSSVFSRADIDALAIATPPATHFEFAKKALLAGKHVFVEKPLAQTVAECEELVQLAHDHRRTLMVGHTFLYDAAVNRIKTYLQEGLAGEIYYINSRRLNFGIVRQDIDAMWNFAPHDLSILLHWLNETPATIAAHGEAHLQPHLVDVAFLHLNFPGGISAHIHVSWLDPGKVRQMTIVGSEKMIVYDDVHPDHKIQIYDKGIARNNLAAHLGEFDSFGKFQLIRRAGDLLIPKIDFTEPLQAQCRHFIDCIRENKRPVTDGEHGLAVVRILEAGRKSLLQKGKKIAI